MKSQPDRFADMYSEGRPPWDIDGPQPALVEVANRVRGAVLDSGCGTGENALFLAERDLQVTGVDIAEAAIETARQRAMTRGLQAKFAVHDALRLFDLSERFDTIVDSGVFHIFDDEDRAVYAEALAHVSTPGARLILLCFSEREPGQHGPRRVTADELGSGLRRWVIEDLARVRYCVRDDSELAFSEGGPHAWRVVARLDQDGSS
jgi:SAM-dependent methyltransferase